MNEGNTLTRTGMLVGTPSYMSPEQIREQPLDARSDLFSFAAVCYELLTGKVAFAAEFAPEVLVRVLLENPDPLSVADPELERSLLHALEKDARSRPGSVAEWVSEILPILKMATTPVAGWNLKKLYKRISDPNTASLSSWTSRE